MNVGRVDFEGALNQLVDLEKSFNIELANCKKVASPHQCSQSISLWLHFFFI